MSESVPRSKIPMHGRVVTKATSSFAKTVSTCAALVSVLSFARAYGVIGDDASHLTVGDIGAVWIGITPIADTAEALNDTLQLAATIKDKSGSALVGASLNWSSDHPEIASVTEGGAVIAHAPGSTTVTATVGGLVARSKVVVRPFVASVRIAGDSTLVLRDGEQRAISARGMDRRGFVIPGIFPRWRSTDSAVISIDSTGVATAVRPGRATLEAAIDSVRAVAPVVVVPTAAAVRVVTGAEQRAPARGTLPLPVIVRVVSRHGLAIPNAKVRFRPLHSDDAVAPDTATTDTDGRAKTAWRLGPMPGARVMHVLAEGVDSTLVVTADAEPVAAETRIVPLDTNQIAEIGTTLPRAVGIRVTDTAGRPLSDLPVSWAALDGGTVEASAARTDSLGEARADWTLSNKAGSQRLRAQVGVTRAVPPVVLRATARPATAATSWLVAGNKQTGVVGEPLAKRIVVRVLDRAGNPVPGATVTFAPARGSVADSAVMADSTGQARATWTLDKAPGEHAMAVRVQGVARPLAVTATARPGTASAIELAPRQATGLPGKSLGDGVVATVTDEYGNVVRGATVTFKASAGALSPARAVTDDKGRVRTRWTLGTEGVEQSLVGRVQGSGASATLTVRLSLPAKTALPKTTKSTPARSSSKTPPKSTPKKPAKRTR